MFIVITIMFAGLATGLLLRRREAVSRISSRLLMPVIYVLLFAMGIIVGSNPHIISNLGTLGLRAAIITVAAVLGSAIAARIVWLKTFPRDEK